PSNELTAQTLSLVLELFEKVVTEGVTPAEVEFALGYLSGSWPFELVTPGDRLGKQLDTILLGLAPDTYARHLKQLAATDAPPRNTATTRWSQHTQTPTATADDTPPRLDGLKLGQVDVLPYDSY